MIKMKLVLTFLIIKEKIQDLEREKLKGALTKTSKYKADTHSKNAFFASKQCDESFQQPLLGSYLRDKVFHAA
jgi:YHS domain-containing protein